MKWSPKCSNSKPNREVDGGCQLPDIRGLTHRYARCCSCRCRRKLPCTVRHDMLVEISVWEPDNRPTPIGALQQYTAYLGSPCPSSGVPALPASQPRPEHPEGGANSHYSTLMAQNPVVLQGLPPRLPPIALRDASPPPSRPPSPLPLTSIMSLICLAHRRRMRPLTPGGPVDLGCTSCSRVASVEVGGSFRWNSPEHDRGSDYGLENGK